MIKSGKRFFDDQSKVKWSTDIVPKSLSYTVGDHFLSINSQKQTNKKLSMKYVFNRSFHFYNSKLKEKTCNRLKCFIQPELMLFLFSYYSSQMNKIIIIKTNFTHIAFYTFLHLGFTIIVSASYDVDSCHLLSWMRVNRAVPSL